jgi:hypothetical protein
MHMVSTRIFKHALGVAVTGFLLAGGIAAAPAQAGVGQPDPAAAVVAKHAGMTWTVRTQTPLGLVNVGSDDQTNAYSGDTPATASLPIICLYVDNSPVPSGITPDFYNGWARGWVALTPAVSGTQLTSRAAANAICASNFGSGWRMAEHHDGWYGNPPTTGGWHIWAHGVVPSQTRFWAAIDDQPANPWN